MPAALAPLGDATSGFADTAQGNQYFKTPLEARWVRRRSRAMLFFRSRLWGDEAGNAVVDDKLAVVFAGMLDETVGHV